jgi:hypothetical protein
MDVKSRIDCVLCVIGFLLVFFYFLLYFYLAPGIWSFAPTNPGGAQGAW